MTAPRPLHGRRALVTGAGQGIGAAIARALAEAGAEVTINDRDPARAHSAAQELTAKGLVASSAPGSIDLEQHCERVVSAAGDVDILVNNAGIASRGRFVVDTDDAELDRLLDVHVRAPFRLCRLLIPSMRKAARSDVVMISSVSCQLNPPGAGPYSMAKAALESLAMTMAKEERPNGMRVNVVAPGLTDTPTGRRYLAAHSEGDVRSVMDTYPFGRIAQPQDVAAAVAFLVSDAGGYVTGQRLTVDGGGSW